MPKITFDPNRYVSNPSPKCPICLTSAEIYRCLDNKNVFEGWCGVCGDVSITDRASERARNLRKAHLLSAALKRRPTDKEYETLDLEDVERILKDAPSFSELDRIDLILAKVAEMTERPGRWSRFQPATDYPMVYATDPEEAIFYLREMHGQGYLQVEDVKARLTIKGYERVQQLQQSGRQSHIAFVAMSFDPTRNLIYDEAIKPAINQAGYLPLRIDKFEHVNRIDDEIIGQIKRSRFMVADFTGQRSGVYFEAGLMLGLGRNVIWMCQKDELGEVHFDTRQYNFIDYDSTADARKRLFDRILAIETEGPKKKT